MLRPRIEICSLDRPEAQGYFAFDKGVAVISVIDYGAGNLFSVCNALETIGAKFRIAKKPQQLEGANQIILPGVGHFGPMMRSLTESALTNAIKTATQNGTPLLGICLGMQALYEASEEAPSIPGLGLLKGIVKRLPDTVRVPHIGWNQVGLPTANCQPSATGSTVNCQFPSDYYFANSYYAPLSEDTTGETEYG